jgi:hypothetical protein
MNSPFISFLLAALTGIASGCSVPNSEPTAGSETHFLTACDDTCGSALSCLCGTCTTSCAVSNECLKLNAAAVCVSASDGDAGTTCEQSQTTAHCDVPCSSSSDCALFGTDFYCSRGYCRIDALSRPNEPFPGYGLLCEQSTVTCATTESPPSLVGTYTGQATVVLSSNSLWAVRNVVDFTAVVTGQANGSLSGTITLPSFTINLQGASVRGETPAFSLYDSTYVDQNGCNLETRAVVSGVLDTSTNPATITGGLALRFTGNYSGTACTTEQINSYPTTGANFQLTATLSP